MSKQVVKSRKEKVKTVLFKTNEEEIKAAARILSGGGLVAFPTETVYGLGADAFDKDAAKKAYAAKGRPSDNPLIVHVAKFDDLYRLSPKDAVDMEVVRKLADTFWPGPLTIILPKLDVVPKETTGGLDTVAIRMPKDDATLKLIEYSGTLVSGPSANTSGGPSPTSWQHVQNDLDGKIDGIICGNTCSGGIESTVIDLSGIYFKKTGAITILRPGLVTPEMIEEATGLNVEYDAALLKKPEIDADGNINNDPNFRPKAPGMKYKHYSPKAEVILVIGDKDNPKIKEIFEDKIKSGLNGVTIYPDTKNFYASLRSADDEGKNFIIAVLPKDDSSLAFSLLNRALKASGYNIVYL